jgi:predicted AlkP superfamily phosphohydrolase/phosphomutase
MRTVILGLDAFDPQLFERLYNQGQLPNLSRYVEGGGYRRFEVSNPPQSEVSWTSIATGLNPGGHGIFDFVHRDPVTYQPFVSLLPTKRSLGGTQFDSPFVARSIFEQATRKGYPATSLWWPATFPARADLPIRTFPGLGTPDVYGQLGVGTLFTSADGLEQEFRKTRIERLTGKGNQLYTGSIKGPERKTRKGIDQPELALTLEIKDEQRAKMTLDQQSWDLVVGKWSPVIELSFKFGIFLRVRALTRIILTSTQPEVNLYILPLQLHPLHSAWQYATPGGFVKNTWQSCGPFLTLGWPQDTTGLEEGCITDGQFLDLCTSIFDTRERILMYHLNTFKEGVIASVFDSLDRIQHMFWRDRQDIIEQWYSRLDEMVGRVSQRFDSDQSGKTHLIVVSDHGFGGFDHKVHLNRWLIDHGYLKPRHDSDSGKLGDVDWEQSRAYALGLNSLYLNLDGREGQGIVEAGQVEPLFAELQNELSSWKGPDGRSIVLNSWRREDILAGPLASYGPDLLIGYRPGYRGSSQTGLGSWEANSLERNQDHWGADHCFDPESVPGVIFSNRGLQNYPNPSYRDFPLLAVGEEMEEGEFRPPPSQGGGEDEGAVEERLKSLGYL